MPSATVNLTRNATFSEIENARAAIVGVGVAEGRVCDAPGYGPVKFPGQEVAAFPDFAPIAVFGVEGVVKGTPTTAGVNAKALRIEVIDDAARQIGGCVYDVTVGLPDQIILALVNRSHPAPASHPDRNVGGRKLGFDPLVQHRRPNRRQPHLVATLTKPQQVAAYGLKDAACRWAATGL